MVYPSLGCICSSDSLIESQECNKHGEQQHRWMNNYPAASVWVTNGYSGIVSVFNNVNIRAEQGVMQFA